MQKLKNKRSDILAGLVVAMFFGAGFEAQGASKRKYSNRHNIFSDYKIIRRSDQEKKRDFKKEVEGQRRIISQEAFNSLDLLYSDVSRRDKRKFIRAILYSDSGLYRIKKIVHRMREKGQYGSAMVERERFSYNITNQFNPKHRQKQREYRNRNF